MIPVRPMQTPTTQKGVVLFISLIVLVAMTLAGIAVTRSVDTGNVIAGNVAFKQATLASADRGIQAAVAFLTAGSNNGNLIHNIPASGYYSANANHTDWTDPSIWVDAVAVPDSSGNSPDAAGNTVSYIIHRLCLTPGVAPDKNCAQISQATAATQGTSMSTGAETRVPPPGIFYRVSVRVDGPRETLSIVQTNVEIK